MLPKVLAHAQPTAIIQVSTLLANIPSYELEDFIVARLANFYCLRESDRLPCAPVVCLLALDVYQFLIVLVK